ncbi:hypothetical protein FOZ63_002770 [Perkinsus olseni]|uniref:Uncharacterized protein n=1 Tax=Perkinsus olseni TaxID=32597 RepID=A0A7J6U8U9_PEROL|nr:hypothetical protein FOZ62_001180 [Perkinsus olseni]KAF4753166.1 hypothetical protein FOZ63_002770 [Perkinsus olseni]
MILRVIAHISFIAIVAHGGSKNRPFTTTRPAPTLGPTPGPTAVVSTPLKPSGGIFEGPGKFVYHSSGPNPVKMIYSFADNVLHSEAGMFSIQCGTGTPYQARWIKSIRGPDDHDLLIAGAKAACPLAGIGPGDFTVLKLDQRGGVITSFGGKDILLERVWHTLYPGKYNSEPGSPLQMHYNVTMDGTVAVILSCATGGTGFKKFKLEGTGIGKPYKLEPMEGGETLKDLVDTLKWVCPDLSEEYFFMDNYQTVGFASEEKIYVAGDYFNCSLHRQSKSSQFSYLSSPVVVGDYSKPVFPPQESRIS